MSDFGMAEEARIIRKELELAGTLPEHGSVRVALRGVFVSLRHMGFRDHNIWYVVYPKQSWSTIDYHTAEGAITAALRRLDEQERQVRRRG